MDLDSIKQVVKPELEELDNLIKDNLYSNISLINDIIANIIQKAGKRIRPLIVLLASNACSQNLSPSTLKLKLAAALEYIHTATLLHDDVVDNSSLRRGFDTANSVWGNSRAILVGDFLYSRAFQLMTDTNSMETFKLVADTTNKMAEGEVLQLETKFSITNSHEDYLDIIKNKTAVLFSACAKVGAILSDRDENIKNSLASYGMHLGVAFQLIDDALDFVAIKNSFGKNIGDDLAEGKATMPLIYAMRNSTPYEQGIIKTAIENADISRLGDIQNIINKTKAVEHTKEFAKSEINKAKESLNVLEDSPYKEALKNLADFIIARNY